MSTYPQLVADLGLLRIIQTRVTDNKLHELFHHLADTVGGVANVPHKLLQPLIVARAADLQIVLQVVIGDNARHFEQICCVDRVLRAFQAEARL